MNEWVKPSKCSSNACVEVFIRPKYQHVYVRDNNNPREISFNYTEWREFIQAIKDGEFDV